MNHRGVFRWGVLRWRVFRWGVFAAVGLLALMPAGAAAQGSSAVSASAGGSARHGGASRYITATASANLSGGQTSATGTPQTLNVGIRVRVKGGDIPTGVKQAHQKLDAIETAIEKAGVAASAIQLQHFDISSQPGSPVIYAQGAAGAAPASASGTAHVNVMPAGAASPAGTAEYTVSEDVQVSTSGLSQLAAAMSAAIAAGATSVTTFTPCCFQNAAPPAGSGLATAIAQATAQAEAEAKAAATAAGVKLGGLHAVTVQPPFQQGPTGAGARPDWHVNVTVSYGIAA